MYKLYNTQKDFTTNFMEFLKKAIPDIRKTQLNIIPYIIFSMIVSESCVPLDMAKVLKDEFSSIQVNSTVKRIRRFFSNKLFKPYLFYQKLMVYILKSFHAKHKDKTLYIFSYMKFYFLLKIIKTLYFKIFNLYNFKIVSYTELLTLYLCCFSHLFII